MVRIFWHWYYITNFLHIFHIIAAFDFPQGIPLWNRSSVSYGTPSATQAHLRNISIEDSSSVRATKSKRGHESMSKSGGQKAVLSISSSRAASLSEF